MEIMKKYRKINWLLQVKLVKKPYRALQLAHVNLGTHTATSGVQCLIDIS
jgi:hypothetical protein